VASVGETTYTSACVVDVSAQSVARVTLALEPGRPGILDCR
jgi:hypothetical protein